jgi:hypothetical protein
MKRNTVEEIGAPNTGKLLVKENVQTETLILGKYRSIDGVVLQLFLSSHISEAVQVATSLGLKWHVLPAGNKKSEPAHVSQKMAA